MDAPERIWLDIDDVRNRWRLSGDQGGAGYVRADLHAVKVSELAREALAAQGQAQDNHARAERLAAENERLRAAISWIEQPFIDDKTPETELRSRVKFAVDDAARARTFAALSGGKDGE